MSRRGKLTTLIAAVVLALLAGCMSSVAPRDQALQLEAAKQRTPVEVSP